jgi:hypothetical protein
MSARLGKDAPSCRSRKEDFSKKKENLDKKTET